MTKDSSDSSEIRQIRRRLAGSVIIFTRCRRHNRLGPHHSVPNLFSSHESKKQKEKKRKEKKRKEKKRKEKKRQEKKKEMRWEDTRVNHRPPQTWGLRVRLHLAFYNRKGVRTRRTSDVAAGI